MIKVPDYRFKNYADHWEQRKFKEYTKLSQGLQIAIADRFLEDGENRYFYITNEFLNPNSDKKYYIESPSKNVICSKRDILMTRTGNTGKVVTDIEGAFHNNFFKVAYDSKESSKLFLFHLLNSPKIQKELLVRAGNSTIPDLNHNDFYSIKTIIPSLLEQTAIGSFFQDIDQLISLQQRKLEVLKEQKKTYLKLLFPAKGQTKPALRFAGFEDEWQRQNFGDYLVEYNEKTVVENQHELLSSTNNGIEPRIGRVSGESNLGYKVIKKGMIVLSPQNLWLGNINYNSKYDLGIVSPSYKIFNIENVDKNFISILIRHPYMIYEYGQASIQGASVVRRNLDIDLFNSIQISLPSLEEQSLIGSFFQDLDKAIAKQEEKVNQLKESKQTLLRKMFI